MLRKAGQDRFLVPRNGILYYWRRVPKTLVDVDSRAPFVRHSLKTDDLAKARSQRDILEKADNELWAAMLLVWAAKKCRRSRSARHSRSIATRLSQTRSPARARRSASSGKRSNVGPSIRSSR